MQDFLIFFSLRKAEGTDFFPTRFIALDAASFSLTITGTALDTTPDSGSVRRLRFQFGNLCTATGTPITYWFDIALADTTVSSDLTKLVVGVTSSVPAGIYRGTWSVCIEYRASPPLTFMRVKDNYTFYTHSVATVTNSYPMVHVANTSTAVTLEGENLLAASQPPSVLSVRLERASTCTSGATSNTLVGTSLTNIGNENATWTRLVVPISALTAGEWSICVFFAQDEIRYGVFVLTKINAQPLRVGTFVVSLCFT